MVAQNCCQNLHLDETLKSITDKGINFKHVASGSYHNECNQLNTSNESKLLTKQGELSKDHLHKLTELDKILKEKMEKVKLSSLRNSRHCDMLSFEKDSKTLNDKVTVQKSEEKKSTSLNTGYIKLLKDDWQQQGLCVPRIQDLTQEMCMSVFLNNLGSWLSHGHDRMMSLAVQACIKQNESSPFLFPK